jgi:pseudaminic acid cytidylyltransferase
MNVAIIPARGGSTRIPRKNIRVFAGKPMISHSIEVAQSSNLFDRIIVSTDDPEIADVARSSGAEVPFVRPQELADAHTGTNAVVKHAIRWLQDHDGAVEFTCCIYATAPFLRARYLEEGLRRLKTSTEQDFAFSVTSFPFPIQRAIHVKAGNGVAPFFPEHIGARSQDLEEAYHDAGQFYWGRTDAYLNERPLFSERSIPIVLPRHLVQDIDTPEDWTRAELMYAALQSMEGV